MTETNPWLCFVPPFTEKLVLGSFPCYNGSGYGDFFYSGSGRNHFWPLLSELSGLPAGNVREKKAICVKHHIALSDVALKVKRRQGNCSDSNLEIIEYNRQGIHRCLAAGARQIFFTSRFVQKHFYRIFPGIAIPSALLLSPSPAANRHIGGLEDYKKMLKKKEVNDVYGYRLRQYRELLFS
jgi:G:T/U-mismatch repair DNA glycosylase